MKHFSAHTPPSCKAVQAHFSSRSQRTIDHFGLPKIKVLTCCNQGLSRDKQVDT
jgi:hypothetical protein